MPTDILGLIDSAVDSSNVSPADNNRRAGYLERSLANVLLTSIMEDGLINRSPNVCTVDESTTRIEAPPANDPIVGLCAGRGFIMGSDRELAGTATGGTITTLVSNGLIEDDDWWNDGWIVFTSGANAGQVRQVTDYDSTDKELTWLAVLPADVQAGDTFVVTFFYIQDLASGVTNYVYGRASDRTTKDALIQWVANSTGVKLAGDILVATIDINALGNVVGSDNAPTGHDRNVWHGGAAVHQILFSGTITGLAASSYVDIVVPHAALILLGPIECTLSSDDCTWDIDDFHLGTQFTLRVTNTGSYTQTLTYSGIRWGRKKVLL